MRATSVEIAGAFNARAFGGATTWLVRSSNLDAVEADGAQTLRDLGVTTVVDLRSEGERHDPIVDAHIVSVPLYDGIAPLH
ncbi:tyrosine-protein phosphatase, partial [Burkholderia cenocepacia]|uniref:tyrosine-protein phosphatase n=1 Tax=Burkholderia cenocepacia TaxID=95486 RepID=UPI0038CC19D0